MIMSGDTGNARRWEPWLALALVAAMLAGFACVLGTHYYIRPSSDPHNWLLYAQRFWSELTQSRWPYGFALFLRLLLPLTGPYWIFLVNLPLLMLALVLVWRLASLPPGRSPDAIRDAIPAGVAAVALALSADAVELVHYVNPYRDPLSYVLLLTSVWWFARTLDGPCPWRLLGPGALLGLACSVREPSVLMLLPMLLYGVGTWRQSVGRIPFWRTTGWFAAGFALALTPLAAQTYAATRQLLLPPQASMQGRVVPGVYFHLDLFLATAHTAWRQYFRPQVWIPLLALAGLATAAIRRHRLMLLLVAPAALTYALFYSFYWTFVARYFYGVTLFLCLLGGLGVAGLIRLATGWMRPVWRTRVSWSLLALMCAASGWRLWRAQPPRRPLQVADARAFCEALRPHVPGNAVVLSQRNLCELIQVVARRDSYAWSFEPDLILPHLQALWDAGRPVLAMEVPTARYPLGDTVHLRRLYDLDPLETFDPARYDLAGFASEPFTLYAVRSAEALRVADALETRRWPAGPGWLMFDPGYWSALGLDRGGVRVTVNGVSVGDENGWPGARIFPLATDAGEDRLPPLLRVEVTSDRAIPRHMRLDGGGFARPIELDFDLHSPFDHRWRWQGDGLLPPDLVFRKPRLRDEAILRVPVPLPSAGRVVMEWQFRSIARRTGGEETLHFYEDEVLLATARVPRDHGFHDARVDLPVRPDVSERRVRIVRENPETEGPPEFEIHRVLLHRLAVRPRLDLHIGSHDDAPYLGVGWYPREETGTPRAFRWTDGHAEFHLHAPPVETDMRLVVTYSVEYVPPAFRDPMAVTVLWNGTPLTPDTHTVAEDHHGVWAAHVPAGAVLESNVAVIQSPSWSPSDLDSPDTRRLGVMLRRIEWAPAP